jgi:hypothetical protein
MPFIETSALAATNVDLAFQKVLNEIYQKVTRKGVLARSGETTGPSRSIATDNV